MLLPTFSMFTIMSFSAISVAIATMSATDLLYTEKEFNEWIQSKAGEEAIANGYFDPTTRENDLQKFFDNKQRMVSYRDYQPDAELSMNTPFAMMSDQEFRNFIKRSGTAMSPSNYLSTKAFEFADKKGIDWTTGKCISKVRDQGKSCGSCWSFASTAALESAYCLKSNNLLDLSEQQLVSCDYIGDNHGCQGGYLTPTFDWVAKNNSGGLCLESEYPYEGKDSKCKSTCRIQKLGVTGFEETKDEEDMYQALTTRPLAAAVHADFSWQFYSGGTLTPHAGELNHAIFVVGYGGSGKAVWKIRNSWGTSWGDQGYVNLYAGKNGVQMGAYPTVE